MKELLEKRKEMKKSKPSFTMQDAHKLARLKQRWRKPKGTDSKMRLHLKGYSKSVSLGYSSPKEVRGLHPSGLLPIVISSQSDLGKIDKEKQGIIISSAVGKKKRVVLLAKAGELKITILNIKDADAYLKAMEEEMKERKEARSKKQKKKEESKKEKKSKEKKDDKLSEKVISEEEKEAKEKKEQEKILTKKE